MPAYAAERRAAAALLLAVTTPSKAAETSLPVAQ